MHNCFTRMCTRNTGKAWVPRLGLYVTLSEKMGHPGKTTIFQRFFTGIFCDKASLSNRRWLSPCAYSELVCMYKFLGGVSDVCFTGVSVTLYWCTCIPLLSAPVVSESLPCTLVSSREQRTDIASMTLPRRPL